MNLSFVPKEEFLRLLALPVSRHLRARLIADACRINTLYSIMRAGSGHIGSSFSAMDVAVWLYMEVIPSLPGALYFSSKGHDAPGLYSIMAALGHLPFEKIHQLRRLNGLPGHPDVAVPGIPCNTGSLGMGISKAKGMIAAARIDHKNANIFVMTGDGELQEGQIWESLQGACNNCMGELTIIVDNNKIQSDTWIEKVSPLGDLEAKFRAFGWEVVRCDGHDFPALEEAFASLAGIKSKPKVLIADTVKGKGVSAMERTSAAGEFEFYKFHSGAPTLDNYADGVTELIKSIEAGLGSSGPLRVEQLEVSDRLPQRSVQRLVTAYGAELVDEARKNPNIVVLDADLMIDCGLLPFAEHFPERFIECGIAEQDMVSQAGGLALQEKLPVVHSFASFLTARANEQIYNNSTEGTKIIYTGSLAGLLPAGPGHSHQSVRDLSLLANIPGLTLIEPCSENETRAVVRWAVNENSSSTYVRLTSIPFCLPFSEPQENLSIGKGYVIREGRKTAIFGYGPVMLSAAWNAAELLATSQIHPRVVALPWLNKVNTTWLQDVLTEISHALFIENGYCAGGQGDLLCRTILENGLSIKTKTIGLVDIPNCGSNDEVLRSHRMDAASLAMSISEWLNE